MTGGGTPEGFTVRGGVAEDCGEMLADGGTTVRDVLIEVRRATGTKGGGRSGSQGRAKDAHEGLVIGNAGWDLDIVGRRKFATHAPILCRKTKRASRNPPPSSVTATTTCASDSRAWTPTKTIR